MLLADIDVTGVDAVLGERPCAGWKFLQQQVPVVVEIANDGDRHA